MSKTQRRPSIRTGRLYVTEEIPGISGFQRWSEREYHIVGHLRAAGRDRLNVIGEFIPTGGTYRLEDGHIPAYQPIASEAAAVEWLAANPYASIAPAKDDARPLCKPL